jgi:hypothetical protein
MVWELQKQLKNICGLNNDTKSYLVCKFFFDINIYKHKHIIF